MTIVVILVSGLTGDADEDECDQVGSKVGDRVDRLCDHSATMPEDPDEELQKDEQGIGATA